jgi:hypothetical protein
MPKQGQPSDSSEAVRQGVLVGVIAFSEEENSHTLNHLARLGFLLTLPASDTLTESTLHSWLPVKNGDALSNGLTTLDETNRGH